MKLIQSNNFVCIENLESLHCLSVPYYQKENTTEQKHTVLEVLIRFITLYKSEIIKIKPFC